MYVAKCLPIVVFTLHAGRRGQDVRNLSGQYRCQQSVECFEIASMKNTDRAFHQWAHGAESHHSASTREWCGSKVREKSLEMWHSDGFLQTIEWILQLVLILLFIRSRYARESFQARITVLSARPF